jgi:hypothetical protein
MLLRSRVSEGNLSLMQLQQKVAVREHLQAVVILTQKLRPPERERIWQHLNIIAELITLKERPDEAKPKGQAQDIQHHT